VAENGELFSRKAVVLEKPMPNGWLVSGEVKSGEKIVINGAQQLLSEELKAQTSEE
jgi:hypothetical protein